MRSLNGSRSAQAVATALAIAVLGSGCGMQGLDSGGKSKLVGIGKSSNASSRGGGPSGGTSGGSDSPVDDNSKPNGTVAVKDFRQLNASFSAVTGVASSDAAVSGVFNGLKSALPQYGVATEIGDSVLKAVVTLTGAYCGRSLATNPTRLFPGGIGTKGAIDGAAIRRVYAAFAGRDPNAGEMAALNALAADLDSSAAITALLKAQVLCATSAASIGSLTN